MAQSGWVILDKDSGLFSRTAGGRIARMLGTKKFGHIGTLDPMATGVLPIAIGDATKMIPFIELSALPLKEYLFSCQFGFETDTLDITGRETARTDIIPTQDMVLSVLPKLKGDVKQAPPLISAVHIGGARAYQLARQGKHVEIPPRPVHIYFVQFLGREGDSWHFRMRCSTGTYVRSVARDMAKMCGTVATVDMIRRTYTTGFAIENSVKLDFLEKVFNNNGDLGEYLRPVDYGLGDIPVLQLDGKDADFYRNGGFVRVDMYDGMFRIYTGEVFIGIGVVYDGVLHPKRTI